MTSPRSPENASATNNDRLNDTSGPRGLVVVLSRDLFFGMRIRASLRPLGYLVSIAQDVATFRNNLTSQDQYASLGLIDFNHPVVWDELAEVLVSGIPMIAFGPHTDVEGFRAAKQAGVARVVSNGEFSRSLPQLVDKYGMFS